MKGFPAFDGFPPNGSRLSFLSCIMEERQLGFGEFLDGAV